MKASQIAALVLGAACSAGVLPLTGCSTTPSSQADRDALRDRAEATIGEFKRRDAGMERFFSSAHGYAVFPEIGKGAVGVGGAYGRGVVFERGAFIGYCDVSQGSVGLQLGGQAFRQVIFFQSQAAFDQFKGGQFAFSANASAVAADAGASAAVDYRDGVAVFTMTTAGLMYEASIGGQRFTFDRAE